MTNPNKTEIIVILDCSASMHVIARDMCSSFDAFIQSQRELPGQCLVTMVHFNEEYSPQYCGKPVAEVPPLELVPHGSTALLDAIGRTLIETGDRLALLAEEDRPGQVLVLIITDGEENYSREFDRARIAEMIKHQQTVYSWAVTFMGANQDAIEVAARIGISRDRSVTYEATGAGARAMLRGLTASVGCFRSGGPMAYDQGDYARAYAAEQRQDDETSK